MKIYIAGASSELVRARAVMDWVRAHPRFELVRDWVKDIEHERVQGGRADSQLKRYEQEHYARANLGAVAESDVLWLLSPSEGVHTTGTWVELGAALVTGHMRQALGLSKTVVLISGPTSTHFLFNSLADEIFDLDADARSWLDLRCAP